MELAQDRSTSHAVLAAVLCAGGAEAALGVAVACGFIAPAGLVAVPVAMVIVPLARVISFRVTRRAAVAPDTALRQLRAMCEAGLIDDADYAERKRQVLDATYGRA